MKRVLILLLALAMVAGLASAKDLAPGALMDTGDFAITAGLGSGIFIGGLDVSAGVEFMMGAFQLGDLPLTWGIAAKANYFGWNSGYLGYEANYSYLGGGAFGTLHFTTNAMKLDASMSWLNRFDYFVGVGLGFFSYSYPDSYDYVNNKYINKTSFSLGFRGTAGLNYFVTENLAITAEGGYYGYGGGGLLGVLFKL